MGSQANGGNGSVQRTQGLNGASPEEMRMLQEQARLRKRQRKQQQKQMQQQQLQQKMNVNQLQGDGTQFGSVFQSLASPGGKRG